MSHADGFPTSVVKNRRPLSSITGIISQPKCECFIHMALKIITAFWAVTQNSARSCHVYKVQLNRGSLTQVFV